MLPIRILYETNLQAHAAHTEPTGAYCSNSYAFFDIVSWISSFTLKMVLPRMIFKIILRQHQHQIGGEECVYVFPALPGMSIVLLLQF